MRYKFSFMLKSFFGDFAYAKRLIKTFHKFNKDNIHMFVVVPKNDLDIFQQISPNKNITFLDETSIGVELVNDNSIRGIRPGYINQTLIKIGFWETGLSENYFCIDSDAEFIKNFYLKDFMFDENIPYSVLVEDKDLLVDPEYYATCWIGRENKLNEIKRVLDFKDPRLLTCHGNTTFNIKVLDSFKKNFMEKNKLSYIDIVKISAYEFSWYNFWLQKSETIPIKFKEPFFKTFHLKKQHLDSINKGITINDISRGYLGIIINSNFSRDYGLISYDTERPYTRSFGSYLKAIKRRVFNYK